MEIKGGGIKPVGISSPWCRVVWFQQGVRIRLDHLWMCPLDLVLMYLLSLGTPSDPRHSLKASAPSCPWGWVCGHPLSPCCVGPCPYLYPLTSSLDLPSFAPLSSWHTTPSWETVLSFTFVVCLHKRQCATLPECKGGTGHAQTFVMCWLWVEGQ